MSHRSMHALGRTTDRRSLTPAGTITLLPLRTARLLRNVPADRAGRSVRYRFYDRHSRACERWLAASYGRDYQLLGQLRVPVDLAPVPRPAEPVVNKAQGSFPLDFAWLAAPLLPCPAQRRALSFFSRKS